MAQRTFSSFHYERDVTRPSVVRNSSKLKSNIDPAWIKAGIWEDAKTKGNDAVRDLIAAGLKNTSVTAVLIGTSKPKEVGKGGRAKNEETAPSGSTYTNIKDFTGNTDVKGLNPLRSKYSTYDWVINDGYNNLGRWVDAAYNEANGGLHRMSELVGKGQEGCSFCKIARGEDLLAEIVCKQRNWGAFFPSDPASPGHTLIIPREHVPDV